MFLSKTFAVSEMDIHQILNINYYKKLQEWLTDVDGVYISFDLYGDTEISIILLRRLRGGYKKEEYCQICHQCFYLEELNQIE